MGQGTWRGATLLWRWVRLQPRCCNEAHVEGGVGLEGGGWRGKLGPVVWLQSWRPLNLAGTGWPSEELLPLSMPVIATYSLSASTNPNQCRQEPPR